MMDARKALSIFNSHVDMWKEWSICANVVKWIDNRGIKHEAKTIAELKEWFESHTARN